MPNYETQDFHRIVIALVKLSSQEVSWAPGHNLWSEHFGAVPSTVARAFPWDVGKQVLVLPVLLDVNYWDTVEQLQRRE